MDPKWVRVIAIVVVVVVVISGVGAYYVLTRPQNCTVQSKNPLVYDQAETPDSLDPDVTFSTPGWAAVQQVYQGLVNYNGSSSTEFSGVLAQSVSSFANPSTGFTSYVFHLRPGVHFSNGDPYNAYVQWYSLYRSLLLEQGPQFILEQNFYSTNFTPSSPLNYYSNLTYAQAANTTLVNFLNTANFDTPTSAELANMTQPNQSFQVLNNLTIQMNLGYGYLASDYTYLNATLSAPNSYAVDPVVVDAHGGIQEGTTNTWLATNMVGTGPYLLAPGSYSPSGTGYSLTVNPSYWGAAYASAEPWNVYLQPAKAAIQINFQSNTAITVQDLKDGAAVGASFAYLGPSTISQLQSSRCVTVQALPTVYGSTGGSWWIYMNQNTAPFNNIYVREAVVHAINYTQIIQDAFGGYGSQWVGPVPPAYPYYNPANLSPYQYNLNLAKQEMAQSPWPNGYPTPLNYLYITPSEDWAATATLLKADLAQIGITLNPVGMPLEQLYSEQTIDPTTGVCTAQEAVNGGPFPIGQEFYTSDYIAPDDWTQNDAISYGSANMCMSAYANATMDNLTLQAAADHNPANLTSEYTQMTQMMYQNYTDAWLVVPTAFAVYNPSLQGIVQNPMASAEPYELTFNTQYVS